MSITQRPIYISSFILVALFISINSAWSQSSLYYFTSEGTIKFKSDAPQEIIRAESKSVRGLLDGQKKTFVFKVAIRSFEGFNSALQREHFNEKYLESEKYPEAVFSGKIIEDIDLSIPGTYSVRAKGMLSIHGIEQERIIKSTVTVGNGSAVVESRFNVSVSEHNIRIPKVVHEKIASEINVEVKAPMTVKTMK